MRCWQYQGFTEAGAKIINETVVVGTMTYVKKFNDGRPDVSGSSPITEKAYAEEVYSTEYPFYDESHDLIIMRFRDGRVLETYVQVEPWSSGPCTFMAIRDHVTKEPIAETLWSDMEIRSVAS